MKKIALYLILNSQFLIFNSFGQSPYCVWAKGSGGIDRDGGSSITTDGSGNVYVTGSFQSSTITFGSTTLTNAGDYDSFTVKYDGSGNVLWAKSAGGTGSDGGGSITTDASGNVYVTGSFGSPTITFGSTILTNSNINVSDDFFIVKYDGSGNVLWAKSAGGTYNDYGFDIAPDDSGNVYISGYFKSASITFGSTVLTNSNTNGIADIFIVKYNGSGNALWAKKYGGTGDDSGSCITIDDNGNIYVTGYFMSPSITFGSTTLTNPGTSAEFYTVKYDGSGNALWAKMAGGTSSDYGTGITTDNSGNVYVMGGFYSPTITFGSTILTNTSNMLLGLPDNFTVKYDNSGNVLWAISADAEGVEGYGITTDGSGNVYSTGYFFGNSVSFGSTTASNPGFGGAAVFTVNYDSNGIAPWAISAGGNSIDIGYGIATDASGNLYVTGAFASGSITFGSTTLTNASASLTTDFFVFKLNGVAGIEDAPASFNMQAYPNPTQGVINISLNENMKSGELSIINMLGDKVYSSPFNVLQGSLRIQLDVSPGIYFVQLCDGEKMFNQKIIVK